MSADHVTHRFHETCNLGGRPTHEVDRVPHGLRQCRSVEPQTWITGQPLQQIVGLGSLLPHLQRDSHGVFLDGLMRTLASHAGTHGRHEHRRSGQEREVPPELTLDDCRVRTEARQHVQQRLEGTVGGKEGIGQQHAPHHRTGDIALVPLLSRHARSHGEVAVEDHAEPVDPFAAAGVHLVGHRRGADLSRPETLGDQLVAGHEPQRGGQRGRTGNQLHQGGDNLQIKRPWIDLPDVAQDPIEAQVRGHGTLECFNGTGVSVEEVELVLLGSHRTLESPQRVSLDKRLDHLESHQKLLAGVGEALTESRCLSGDVVAAPHDHGICVQRGQLREPGQSGDCPIADQLEATTHLELLHVLGEIARRHPGVGVLVTGEVAELLDTGLHIVARHPLAGVDRVQVHRIDHRCVVGDGGRRNVYTQFGLGRHDGDPQASFQNDLVLRRPELHHLRAGVAVGEHVGDAG